MSAIIPVFGKGFPILPIFPSPMNLKQNVVYWHGATVDSGITYVGRGNEERPKISLFEQQREQHNYLLNEYHFAIKFTLNESIILEAALLNYLGIGSDLGGQLIGNHKYELTNWQVQYRLLAQEANFQRIVNHLPAHFNF